MDGGQWIEERTGDDEGEWKRKRGEKRQGDDGGEERWGDGRGEERRGVKGKVSGLVRLHYGCHVVATSSLIRVRQSHHWRLSEFNM